MRHAFFTVLRADFAAGFFFNLLDAFAAAFAKILAAELAATFAAPLPWAFARNNVLVEFFTRG